jgi:hypothetical protein
MRYLVAGVTSPARFCHPGLGYFPVTSRHSYGLLPGQQGSNDWLDSY